MTNVELLKAAIAILAILIFTIAEALADAFQFRDIRKKDDEIKSMVSRHTFEVVMAADYNRQWHFWQAVRQATFIIFAAIYAGHFPVAFITASLFWLIHDGIVNIIGLNRKFFFVGTTAFIDRLFQRFPNPSLAMGIAKVAILALSIAAFFIF